MRRTLSIAVGCKWQRVLTTIIVLLTGLDAGLRGLELNQLDARAVLARLKVDDQLGVVQQLNVAVNNVPELVVLSILL